jgi:uncharacterized protein (TIGR02270 family)
VYAKHLEEFQFLWGQRQTAIRSPDHKISDLARLEERLAAHLDGLLLPAETAIPVLETCLEESEPPGVFAAAYVLLRLRIQAAADRVVIAFLKAGGEKIDAFGQALCHGPIDLVEGKLRGAAASAPAPAAAVALEALTFHRRPDCGIDRLVEFLQNENPQVRRTAWRVMALMSPTEMRNPFGVR